MVHKRKRFTKSRNALFLMTLPFLVMVIMFNYVPLFGWSFAFFNYRPGIPLSDTPFVGLHYFQFMANRLRDISRVLTNTFAMGFLGILTAPLPMFTAILINAVKITWFRRFTQTTITIPYFVSWVIVYGLAFSLFASQGLVNNLLIQVELISRPVNLLGNPDSVWMFQTILGLWKFLGWNTIIYLAAISGIDEELYQAAEVDGAGRFQRTWHITLPGLMPTFAVLLLLSISMILGQGFEQYFVFNNPQVENRIEVLDLYVFRIGLATGNFSYGTAIGILKTLVSITFLFTCNWFVKKVRGEGII